LDKEMERNLLLAFVITLVISLLWFRVQGTRTPPVQPAEEPSGTVTTQVDKPVPEPERPAETAKPAAPPAAVDLSSEQAKAEDVVIDTPLVQATFTTLGARVKSIKLKEPYEGVDIVPPREDEEAGELPLGMTMYEDVGGSLPNKLNFDVEKDGYTVAFKRDLGNDLVVTKEFRFNPDNYDIELTIGVENQGAEMVYVGLDQKPSYALWWGPGVETMESDRYNRTTFTAINDGTDVHKYEHRIKSVEVYRKLSWFGLKSRYFLIAIAPLDAPSIGRVLPMHAKEIALESLASSFRLDPREKKENEYVIYAGPQDMVRLREVGRDLRLEEAVNFGWFDWFSKILLRILKFCYRVVPNYGVGIIVLTIIVRMALYPLTHKSMQSMKKMQALQPEMAKLREQYKDNPQELNKRTMAFYKEQGVNPMGGCLPMMLQMPIWIALFRVYNGAIELRGAPFFAWITDLSEPDTIATLPFSLPFFRNEVHVLPLLMAGAMFLQQKLMSPGGSASTEQQRMMAIIFPVMFGLLFYHMPSGLCLYIFVSTMLYFVQQLITHKGRTSTPEAQAVIKK